MTMPNLNTQLKNLEHTQELDLKLDALKKVQSAFPLAVKGLHDVVKKAEATLGQKKALLEELDKNIRQNKAAAEMNQERTTRSMERLSGIKNSQEFQAMNKEIDQLKKMAVSLDEQLKKFDSDRIALTAEVASAKETLAEQAAALSEKESEFSGETGKLQREMELLLQKRAELAQGMEKRMLTQYERVRSVKGGIGMAPVLAGRCKSCNMMVPPQLYNQIQKEIEYHACPSCHRILFLPPTT